MKSNKNEFKGNLGKNLNFKDGWNCFGLTLRGDKETIESLLKHPKLKMLKTRKTNITNEILEVEFIDNYGGGAYVPIELAYEILTNYPSLKYATFWEGIEYTTPPQLYIVYSESGTTEITDSEYISTLSSEDEYNELLHAKITNKKKQKFKYNVSDSHNGYEDTVEVEYAFPFFKQFEDNNYIKCEDKPLEELVEEEKLDIDLQNIDLNYISSPEFKKINDNEKYMIKFIEYHQNWLGLVSERLRDNEDFLLTVLQNNSDIGGFNYISDRLKNNKEFALKVMKINYKMLLNFSEEIKNDQEFIKKVIKLYPQAGYYIGNELKNNKDFLLSIIDKKNFYCGILDAISKELYDDEEFVLECSKYGNIIYYISNRLKDDGNFLLSLPKTDKFAYSSIAHSASARLKNDQEFMLKVIEKEPLAMSYASKELQNNKKFIISVIDITKGKTTYDYDKLFLDDEEVMLKRLEYNKTVLANASDRLKNDKDFFLKAIKIYDKSLKYASKQVKEELKGLTN